MHRNIIILSLVFFILIFISAGRSEDNIRDSSMPVFYPEKTIGSVDPYFIWYDKNAGTDNPSVKYRLIVKQENGPELPALSITPGLFDSYYFYYRFSGLPGPGNYSYSIEKIVENKPDESKYYHNLKYPLNGEFVFNPEKKSEKEDLKPEKLIEYLRLEKENRLVNRNNMIFYGSAGAGCFGIGLLFYKVIDFGIISRIIYYTAFASSGAGLGASGYYGYKYFSCKNQLQKIIDIERNVSINGALSATDIAFDIKIAF